LYDTVTYKSDVEKGNNLMLTKLKPVATLVQKCNWLCCLCCNIGCHIL